MKKSNGVSDQSDQCISWGPKARLTVGCSCQIGDVLPLLFVVMMTVNVMMVMVMMMMGSRRIMLIPI